MSRQISIMGGSIAEVDEIQLDEEEVSPGKSGRIQTQNSGEELTFIQLLDSSPEEVPGSDEDEIDDLYYNQKLLAKQLDKIKNLPAKLTYLVSEIEKKSRL